MHGGTFAYEDPNDRVPFVPYRDLIGSHHLRTRFSAKLGHRA